MRYAEDFIAGLSDLRHELHRAPEISGEEEKTARKIAEWLRGCDADVVMTEIGGHGVVGVFDSGKAGPAILFRCELDGLPIHETGLPSWRSLLPGKGHMCGHDGHMAILCGLAKRLQAIRPAKGRVVLLFQPAEETGAGARAVVDDQRFEEIRPDFAFGLHNLPGLPLGHVGVKEGPFCFASEGMAIHLTGWTSHAAHPEDGRSPAAAMIELVDRLPRLPKDIGMQEGSALVTLSHARLGECAFGIAPGEALVMATLRSVEDGLQERLMASAEDLARKTAKSGGLEISISRSERFASCANDARATEIVRDACTATGTPVSERDRPFRWSEDFGVFGSVAPSAFFVVGAGEACPQLHNPDYDFPDALIGNGLALFEQIVRTHCF